MQFIASSGTLLKKLSTISGIIGTNTVLPILSDFLFEIKNKSLTVSATDLETLVKVNMEIESKASYKICIPSKIILETLKNLPEQPLTFNIDNDYNIEIISNSGKYKIKGEAIDSFPKEPAADSASSFKITSADLIDAIEKTLVSASNDDLRPAMTGVYFEISNKEIVLVSTDAHRLTKYTIKGSDSKGTHTMIVPRKPLNILKSTLENNATELEVEYNNNYLFVKNKNIELACRLIDARFPDYKVVIPTQNPYTLTVNKSELVSALKRVLVFSNKSTSLITFGISKNNLHILGQDIDLNSEGNEDLPCTFDGDDIELNFNGKFLFEMLANVTTDNVVFKISSSAKAVLVLPSEQEDGKDLTMLVMPLRMS